MAARICTVELDDAYCVGDEADLVYFDAAQDEATGKWFTSGTVDSDTGSFVDSLFTDDGPHDTERDALRAGLCLAVDWCLTNDVAPDEQEAIDAIDRRCPAP